MELNKNPHMTDEEYDIYVREYAEWLDQYMLDPEAWMKEFELSMESK